jgi:hypothetical protein
MSELSSNEPGSGERASTVTSPTMASQEAPLPLQRVGPGFILAYAFAYFGAWIALLAPVVVTLALRVQQLDPVGKVAAIALVAVLVFALVLKDRTLDPSLRQRAPPDHRASNCTDLSRHWWGNNYTALFIAAAVYALLGALAIQPVKGVR